MEVTVSVPVFLNIKGIRLINSLGQVMETKEIQHVNETKTARFDIAAYPPGLYILQSTGGEKVLRARVLKL
jgi:hypothetical protein